MSLKAGAVLCVAFGTMLWQAPAPARAAEGKRPNVLFLLADDQRADTIAALGNPVIKTPSLDSLVNAGFVFDNAYCLGSSQPAVCLPSRCMLLSGRAYFRPGMGSPTPPNFPTSMKGAGYFTYHDGKAGNTPKEIQKLFDDNHYIPDVQDRESGHPGKLIVDRAIEFLQNRRRDQPFCLYLAFANPHDPRVAAQEYLDLYDRAQIPLPKNYLAQHPFDNGEMTVRDEKLAPWPRTEDEMRKQLHEYYAVISGLDFQIGRLFEALRALGELNNTLIVFSSDHGLAMGSHGLMGKQNLYEHSMKSPLIFAGPGVPHGRSAALVYLLDIYPTICGLVGAEVPQGIDGQNLAPIIRGQERGVRDSLFLAYRDVQRAVRDDRWKLIRYPQIHKSQLFDLEHDPDELRNLADEPAQQQRVRRMLEMMEKWQRELGDSTPLSAPERRNPDFTPPAT